MALPTQAHFSDATFTNETTFDTNTTIQSTTGKYAMGHVGEKTYVAYLMTNNSIRFALRDEAGVWTKYEVKPANACAAGNVLVDHYNSSRYAVAWGCGMDSFQVAFTNNSGASWTTRSSGVNTCDSANCVVGLRWGNTAGELVTITTDAGNDKYRSHRTTNWGASFTVTDFIASAIEPGITYTINNIDADPNSNRLVGIGSVDTADCLIRTSSDSGSTWSTLVQTNPGGGVTCDTFGVEYVGSDRYLVLNGNSFAGDSAQCVVFFNATSSSSSCATFNSETERIRSLDGTTTGLAVYASDTLQGFTHNRGSAYESRSNLSASALIVTDLGAVIGIKVSGGMWQPFTTGASSGGSGSVVTFFSLDPAYGTPLGVRSHYLPASTTEDGPVYIFTSEGWVQRYHSDFDSNTPISSRDVCRDNGLEPPSPPIFEATQDIIDIDLFNHVGVFCNDSTDTADGSTAVILEGNNALQTVDKWECVEVDIVSDDQHACYHLAMTDGVQSDSDDNVKIWTSQDAGTGYRNWAFNMLSVNGKHAIGCEQDLGDNDDRTAISIDKATNRLVTATLESGLYVFDTLPGYDLDATDTDFECVQILRDPNVDGDALAMCYNQIFVGNSDTGTLTRFAYNGGSITSTDFISLDVKPHQMRCSWDGSILLVLDTAGTIHAYDTTDLEEYFSVEISTSVIGLDISTCNNYLYVTYSDTIEVRGIYDFTQSSTDNTTTGFNTCPEEGDILASNPDTTSGNEPGIEVGGFIGGEPADNLLGFDTCENAARMSISCSAFNWFIAMIIISAVGAFTWFGTAKKQGEGNTFMTTVMVTLAFGLCLIVGLLPFWILYFIGAVLFVGSAILGFQKFGPAKAD